MLFYTNINFKSTNAHKLFRKQQHASRLLLEFYLYVSSHKISLRCESPVRYGGYVIIRRFRPVRTQIAKSENEIYIFQIQPTKPNWTSKAAYFDDCPNNNSRIKYYFHRGGLPTPLVFLREAIITHEFCYYCSTTCPSENVLLSQPVKY